MNILNKKLGFTLMEMMITVIIISLLTAAAVPYYRDYIERQKVAIAATDLRMIADSVERYKTLHNEAVPSDLTLLDADIDRSKLSNNNQRYNNGDFTFWIDVENRDVVAARNNGQYSLYYGFDEDLVNYGLNCMDDNPNSNFCSDKLNL